MKSETSTMTASKLAEKARVHVETIRYYERKKLMPMPSRRPSGYRQYTETDIRRIRFIKHAQELGFSLKQIAELLSLRVHPRSSCAKVKEQSLHKIADIEGKLRSLRKMKTVLENLVRACSGRGPTADCPILESLEEKKVVDKATNIKGKRV